MGAESLCNKISFETLKNLYTIIIYKTRLFKMEKTGYVYKLCCRDPTIKEVYVGSSKNLRVRKSQHKNKCNTQNCKEYNYKVYQFIRANGGFDNWDVIQLEEVEHNTRHELHSRERHFFELLNATLNKCVPNRTPAESVKNYFVNHRNEINERL